MTAIALADMLPNSRVGQWLAESDHARRASPAGRLAFGRFAAGRGPGGDSRFQAAGIAVPVIGHGWARFDPARWPLGLVPRLQEIEQTGGAGPGIFNDLNFGGFLDPPHAGAAGVYRRSLLALRRRFSARYDLRPPRGPGPARSLAKAVRFSLCLGRDGRAVRLLLGRRGRLAASGPNAPRHPLPVALAYGRFRGRALEWGITNKELLR